MKNFKYILILIHLVVIGTNFHYVFCGQDHEPDGEHRDPECSNENDDSPKNFTHINEKCEECLLLSKSIDDIIRRPRQSDPNINIEERIDIDKIQKLICRDYLRDYEREKCRNFYFDHLPSVKIWAEQSSKTSFHDYICIQKHKYCCPANSFGPRCRRCPNCNPNEQCLGAGSRSGKGICGCKDGHTGPTCSSCSPGYYSPGNRTYITSNQTEKQEEVICRICHKSCLYCRSEGPLGCEVCAPGFVWRYDYGCIDIDECVGDKSVCGTNTFCVNTEGSYFCYDCDRGCDGCHSDGPDNCIKCAKGHKLDKGVCKPPIPTIIKPEAHYTRYLIYAALAFSSLILYSNNVYLAGVVGLAGALYAGGSEYFLSTQLQL